MIGIAYLASYNVALSSLAFHTLYTYLKELEIPVHRITLEQTSPLPMIRDHDARFFQPNKFSAYMISIPYEILYRDLVILLKDLKIPVLNSQREEHHPIILGGGPAVTANPLPTSGILDAIVVGEPEDHLEEIVSILESDYSRASKLKRLAEIPGVYVHAYSEEVERTYVKNLDTSYHPIKQIVEKDITPIWGRSLLVEASRGCSRGCFFCMEGRIFLPARHRSYSSLSNIVEKGLEATGYRKVSFYSLSFFDNPAAEKVLEKTVSEGLKASVPSLRVDTLDRKKLELMRQAGQNTLTIAPETGSCSLAKAINKHLCATNTIPIVEDAVELGFPTIKMYVMTGFSIETDDMFNSTLSMIEESAKIAKRGGSKLRVTVNPLIPKPHTPLQWHGATEPGLFKQRLNQIRKKVRRLGVEIDSYNPRYARLQTILSRGDERITLAIIAWGSGGGYLSGWRRAVRETGLNEEYYLKHWDPGFVPPWHKVVRDRFNSVDLLSRAYTIYVELLRKF
ncbi:MAG: B12-binding domain-containing radical SAM protein [Desulfurococcales archaeon]|nr:B12-binding domain-containing radical SAM protein [Desulfurococcales archaeon]